MYLFSCAEPVGWVSVSATHPRFWYWVLFDSTPIGTTLVSVHQNGFQTRCQILHSYRQITPELAG